VVVEPEPEIAVAGRLAPGARSGWLVARWPVALRRLDALEAANAAAPAPRTAVPPDPRLVVFRELWAAAIDDLLAAIGGVPPGIVAERSEPVATAPR
jgi:hypothetical protein